ncbi:MAG: pyridoxal phosphate-dependent aminotransferase [Candidatus Stahlbacteria bacterium]|nr:pyridoxal phosphate-dependent aminotransferase [Candidatus Stahlbacteria bacterium]
MISSRVKLIAPSPIRKLVPYANEAKKKGIKIYHLNIGQPDIRTPAPFWDGIKYYKEEVLGYGPSDGFFFFREAVAEYYNSFGANVEPYNVFVTTGGSEAILFIYLILGDIGDEFLIPEPSYANYITLGAMAQIKLIPIPTSVENGFHLPKAEKIEPLITPKTRGMIICTPNNPTGTVYTKEEMELIAGIAKKHKLFVISDEVYREFLFDSRHHISIFNIPEMEEYAIVIDSISKRFSACGARIGFAVTKNRQVLEALMLCGMSRLCPPTIEQIGALQAFKKMDEFIPQMIKEYKRRRDVVYEEINKIPGSFACLPEGAFYVTCRLPVPDVEEFAKWMLTEFNFEGKTTMIAPAEGFYLTPGKGKDEVRIAYVIKEEELRDAMQILKKGIEKFR